LYDSAMLKEDIELDPSDFPKVYMDERLKQSPELYHRFIKDLWERNMIDFSHERVSTVTPFFVVKKSGKLRLVPDCRATNEVFRPPPDIAMPAGYSFSQLQMSDEDTLYIAQTDIKDYFYSIGLPVGLRPYFAFPQVDLHAIAPDHPLCRQASGPLIVFPRMKVVPMDWNWAMYIAQRAHQYQAMLAAQVGVERVVVDGRPVPRLDRSTPTLLVPYADNLNIVGICQKEVQQLKDKITEHLNSIGFITHEEQAAEPHAEALGFLLDGVGGRVLPRPIKRDKVRKVLLWLSSQPRVNGRMIEKVIGHCVHFFMLRRECLSVFRAVYDFKQCLYGRAAALLLVCHADLKRGWTGHVTCSDASLTGTGVCAAEFDIQDVCNTGSQRELRRYKSKNAAHNARDHFSKADPFTDLATVKKQKSSSEIDCFVINDEFKEDHTEQGRSEKRRSLAQSHNACPRTSQQTFLEQAAVSPRTALDYQFRLGVFQSFCKLSKLSLRSPENVDSAFVIFLNQCFMDGMGLNEVTKFLAAIMDARPELSPKHVLARSRRALKGWKNLDPGTSRPPEAWPVVALIVAKLLELRKIEQALFVLTMFVTYCRPFELLILQSHELVETTVFGTQYSLVLNKTEDLEMSKVGMQDESMILDNKEIPWLGKALAVLKRRHMGLQLFNLSYHDLRDAWLTAMKLANLPEG
ncbi:unnamed protein product, partial [Durusdinium trenchii]